MMCFTDLPYTTLFRSGLVLGIVAVFAGLARGQEQRRKLTAEAVMEEWQLKAVSPGQDVHATGGSPEGAPRSGEHTSELQSPCNIVCSLLHERKRCRFL